MMEMTLGKFIEKRREDFGFKKIEFSKMLNITDDTLRSWERDRFIPAGKNRRAIIQYLKFTSDEAHKYFYGK